MQLRPIASLYNDFPTKFGLPRQSSLAPSLLSRIVFNPEFRNPDALRGIEGFSHLWIIWQFSESGGEWSPTVRPPRLGGNRRMGVFATRSPFRPNALGLTCVKLEKVDLDSPDAPVLYVSGADIMSGTPVFDIKPYLPGVESHPDAKDGFVGLNGYPQLEVIIPESALDGQLSSLDDRQIETLREILAEDPRPAYHDDPERIYGLEYAGCDIHFRVGGGKVTVIPQSEQISSGRRGK